MMAAAPAAILDYEKCQSLSRVQLFATPWTVACQAPLSTEFSRQEYWSGLSCPPPGDLPNPDIQPGSAALQADSLLFQPSGKPWTTWKPQTLCRNHTRE